MQLDKEDIRLKLASYAHHGKKFERALEAVASGSVKEHRFLPSGKIVLTVVGQLGDEFIDPRRPYCSCGNFYFRVMARREEVCYHLLSYEMAMEAHAVDTVDFDDEEFESVMSAISRDVFGVIDKSAGS